MMRNIDNIKNLLKKRGLLIPGITISLIGAILIIYVVGSGSKPCGWLDGVLLKHSGCSKELNQAVSIREVAFLPDGIRLATASFHGQIQLWRLEDSVPIFALSDNEDLPARMAISPDGTILAVT